MANADTELGGLNQNFPATTVGMVSALKSPLEKRAGLGTLSRRYWKPIYRYVRIAWAKSNEDAKDLTQAFLIWLMDSDALVNFDPSRGSFRRYLQVILKRFVGHQEEALRRLKRGGGVDVISLDGLPLPPEDDSVDPEKAFTQSWMMEVVAHALNRVRARAEASGLQEALKTYEACVLGTLGQAPSQAELAEKLGVSPAAVKKHLFTIRQEIRTEIRAELAQMTSDPRELNEEWNAIFGA